VSFALGEDHVHVWRVDLGASPAQLRSLWGVLDGAEKARAERFHFARDRARFVAGRGTLRVILARYLDRDPAGIVLVYGSHGKPALAPSGDGARISFNLSHSGDLALLAVCLERRIGIDLEQIRPAVAGEDIARRVFSPRENAALDALPPEHRLAAFFHCWTRKEAFVKASGEGLALPLDHFDVSLAPGEPAVLLRTAPDPTEARRWSLVALDAGPGHAAALAVEMPPPRVQCRPWCPATTEPLEPS
jgi:4'-phosphopantetheinyl transferase